MVAEVPEGVSIQVLDALEMINAHHAADVVGVKLEDSGRVVASVDISVNLPTRAAAVGYSKTGVRAVERVEISFPPTFPNYGPRFSLREDFPANLPHIYQHQAGQRVPPCITFGTISDVVHSEGMFQLIVQMVDWLNKAATDELTNQDQGWEPGRLLDVSAWNVLTLDPDALVVDAIPWGQWQMYMCEGSSQRDRKFSYTENGRLYTGELTRDWYRKELVGKRLESDNSIHGPVPVVVCWPAAKDEHGAPVDSVYRANTVRNVGDLSARADELGCKAAYDDFLAKFNKCSKYLSDEARLQLIFVFPIRRPVHVIGCTSSYEMVAYRFEQGVPGLVGANKLLKVDSIAFRTPASRDLLRRASGLKTDVDKIAFSFVGCGSVGSKLVMSLARAGIRPLLLADEKMLAGHNVARHTLLPVDAKDFAGKAARLAEHVESFGLVKPQIFVSDIRTFDFGLLPEDARGDDAVVVNSTGSPMVRDVLTRRSIDARVLETAFVNRGEAAFLTLEGVDRNPTSADLMYDCYERMRAAGLLHGPVSEKEHLLDIGVGCHSVTIAMSDAHVSLVTAGVAQKLLTMNEAGLSDSGMAGIATFDPDGMSVRWQLDDVGATHVATLHESDEWVVRILHRAHVKIQADVAKYPHVETGGMIVGSVSHLTREIFISDVLDAPPDSKRSAVRFDLGTDGRAEAIEQYQASGAQTLWWLGTWHSHLSLTAPSQMDLDTADEFTGQLRGAAVLLIHHPGGYAAVVRKGSAEGVALG
jgi:hypothetical protein